MASLKALSGKTALVTGASRGIGRDTLSRSATRVRRFLSTSHERKTKPTLL